jgi:adenylate cyclase, class 2
MTGMPSASGASRGRRFRSAEAKLELKARDPAPGRTLAAARALGAEDRGSFAQRDTFFKIPAGRLKLREEEGRAELIEYMRPDSTGPRRSTCRLLAIDDPDALRELLAAELGELGVVEKRRRLLVKSNARIHLDHVAGLGSFVEIEAASPPGHRPERELPTINALRRGLWITDDRLVDRSYIDLLREAESTPPARPPPQTGG